MPRLSLTPEWTPLSTERHAGWHWQRNATGLRFASRLGRVPVNHLELGHLLGQFVLAIQRTDRGLNLVALLSLTPGRNVYVDPRGAWRAPYLPARLRAYPFGLLTTGDGKTVAALDTASGLFDPDGVQGEPLLDAQGQPAAEVARLLKFLDQLVRAERATVTLCEHLGDAGLLKPWRPIAPSDPAHHHDALHEIDRKALAQLDPDTLAALHQNGGLQLAHGLIFSQTRLPWLNKAHEKTAPAQDTTVNLDNLFDGGDDGVLRFDFD